MERKDCKSSLDFKIYLVTTMLKNLPEEYSGDLLFAVRAENRHLLTQRPL